MLNYTAFRPSVLSRPDLSGPHRKLARGIRLTTIIAGLTVTVAIFASLTSVAIAQTAPTSEKGPVGLFFQVRPDNGHLCRTNVVLGCRDRHFWRDCSGEHPAEVP